jgi:UDP-N-acetylmuramoylalanine--D-glutamate ligase
MGGNIGIPIMAQDALPEGGVYVLELSSYQIDLSYSLACDVALLLNITPDHLDRYADFDGYAASKARLFSMLADDGAAILSGSDAHSQDILKRLQAGSGNVLDLSGAKADGQADWPALQGPHNCQNAIAAASAGAQLGIAEEQLERALKSFGGLPHRMEIVTTHGGVLFINDSKATNQASTAPALAAYAPEPNARIHWIVGGLAKEDGLGECEDQLGNVKAAYTIGESGPRFAEMLEGRVPVEKCELLCEAVTRAVDAAESGDVILLSPACASFDQFRDYETRGEHFRQIVTALTEGQAA